MWIEVNLVLGDLVGFSVDTRLFFRDLVLYGFRGWIIYFIRISEFMM